MRCKADGINLLSLRCAFIPNGFDMSRVQDLLPSHCTAEERTLEKREWERENQAAVGRKEVSERRRADLQPWTHVQICCFATVEPLQPVAVLEPNSGQRKRLDK